MQMSETRVYKTAARGGALEAAAKLMVALTVAFVVVAAGPRPAFAEQFTVTTTNDSGPGSLRQAILDANDEAANLGADTITFEPALTADGGATINLSSTDGNAGASPGPSALVVTSEIAVQGPTGKNGITIARASAGGTPEMRLLYVRNVTNVTTELTLKNLTLRGGLARGAGGAAGLGGAVFNEGGLSVEGSTLSGNTAQGGAGGDGAAGSCGPGGSGDFGSGGGGGCGSPDSPGSPGGSGGFGGGGGGGGLGSGDNPGGSGGSGGFGGGNGGNGFSTSFASGSSGSGGGGGFGGAIFNLDGSVNTASNTISGNIVAGGPGGRSNGVAGGAAGGVYSLQQQGGNATLDLVNTIVANSSGGTDCENNAGTATGKANLIEKNAGCAGIVSKADPKLNPLTDNGGPTATHALGSRSPAIDAGPAKDAASCPVTDQRGVKRAKDGDGTGKGRCDIGTFEQKAQNKGRD